LIAEISCPWEAAMAIYKDPANLHKSNDLQFDAVHDPGVAAPHAGIYRCVGCGYEIGMQRGHILPSQSHPHNASLGKIKWKLLVFAQQKDA